MVAVGPTTVNRGGVAGCHYASSGLHSRGECYGEVKLLVDSEFAIVT